MKTFLKYSYQFQWYFLGSIIALLFIRDLVIVDTYGTIDYYSFIPEAFILAAVFSRAQFPDIFVILAGTVSQLTIVQFFGYTKNTPSHSLLNTLILGYFFIILVVWFIRRGSSQDSVESIFNEEAEETESPVLINE